MRCYTSAPPLKDPFMFIADVLKCVRPAKTLCFTRGRLSLQYVHVCVLPGVTQV